MSAVNKYDLYIEKENRGSVIVIGLPAYNEEKNIGKLLDKIINLKETLSDSLYVLIVNDGSTDDTEAILKEYAANYEYISYLNHKSNLGLGYAVNSLINFAVNNYTDADILITLDADNTHNPKLITKMVKSIRQNKLDIVIASRFLKGSKELGLSVIRKLCSRGAMLFCYLAFYIRNVRDYSCGYRAYRIGFLRRLLEQYDGKAVSTRGFECMVELLAKAGLAGVKAGEVPLVLEYNLKEGESKMKIMKTIKGYIKLAIKIRRPVLGEKA